MKKLIYVLVFLFPVVASGQQWKPVSSTEKFNFRIDTTVYISNVICVDSLESQSGDTVLYLNRIVTPCPGGSFPYLRLYNQPQFMERKMTRKPGGIYMFSDPGRFWINSLASLNASWIFDSATNVTAEVSANNLEQILNQWDSVKTISLSNGHVIRLSKDHGIIEFPLLGTSHYYLLEGIAGRNLGILVPGFKEIYNFNVGDVFQYRNEQLSFAIGYGTVSLLKKTVVSKDSSSSGYTYGIVISEMRWQEDIHNIPWDTTHYYYNATEIYIDSTSHFCNHNPHELVRNPPGIYDNEIASIMKIYPDTGQAISRVMGDYDEGSLYSFGGVDTLLQAGVIEYGDKYTVGLGRVIFRYDPFEGFIHEILIGYVKKGDTVGIIYPDNFLLEKLTENPAKNLIHLFPNPVKDKFILETSSIPGNSRLSIVNVHGQELIAKQITDQKTLIDITEFPSGVYFVRLTNDRTVEVGKIIKQ
jgi:Secretion system C-terminal sorting domain